MGETRDEAIRDAAVRAVEQVQGRAIAVAEVSQEIGSVATQAASSGTDGSSRMSAEVTAVAGGRQLSDATHGIISTLRVIHEVQVPSGWSVTVNAAVAKYAPRDDNKAHVVVPLPTSDDPGVPASLRKQVGDAITDALTASGRIAVLDRSDDEIEAELAFAGSSDARATEHLKLAQADVADYLVIVRIESVSVEREARRMRTADREIVAYKGSAAMSYRVVHVASREVVESGGFTAHRSMDEALVDTVNVDGWKEAMLRELEAKVAQRVTDAFVSVAAR
jgi:hypothetical protein